MTMGIFMKRLIYPLLVAFVFLARVALAQEKAAPRPSPAHPGPRETADEVMVLPDMEVNSGRLGDYPFIDRNDISGGGLAPGEPPINIMYPGKAFTQGVPVGLAKVCIGLDEKGEATDYLLMAYTERYFGEALLAAVKATKFRPYLFKGVPIPSRYEYSYRFLPDFAVPLSGFDAIESRELMIHGGRPEFKYRPVTEAALDSRLERVRAAVPHFPPGYAPTGGKADWVMVTLYIDEEGKVRVPRVESASSPLLVRNALLAVSYWRFKPPTVKGKPVLVYAAFAVNFIVAPAP
jgi:hypothetical protein